MPIKLEGIFPPVPTPFDSEGRILHDKLKANLQRWNTTGLHGYAVLGTNGEFVFLNEAEKVAVWETARAAIPRDKLFLAGAGAESTQTALALARRAAEKNEPSDGRWELFFQQKTNYERVEGVPSGLFLPVDTECSVEECLARLFGHLLRRGGEELANTLYPDDMGNPQGSAQP